MYPWGKPLGSIHCGVVTVGREERITETATEADRLSGKSPGQQQLVVGKEGGRELSEPEGNMSWYRYG